MKNIKNIGLSLVLFLGINPWFAAAGELSDISNNAGTLTNPLSESLRDFKSENPQFDYGIASIAELYSKEIDIDDFYSPKQSHPYLRKALFASELVAEGICGYLRASLLYSINYKDAKLDIKWAGGFVAAYTARTALNVLSDLFCKPTEPKPFAALLTNMGQVNSVSTFQISKAINDSRKIDINPVLNISKTLIEDAKSENFSEETLLKIERLRTLVKKVDTDVKIKKLATHSYPCLSFLAGASCFIKNRYVATISYPIALTAQYAGASINTEKDNFQRYIALSEMLYLCDDLINGEE